MGLLILRIGVRVCEFVKFVSVQVSFESITHYEISLGYIKEDS